MTVPNQFPTLSAPYRIAFIGEAPGRDEESSGKPFIGQSGRLFNALLSKANILREACFVGNVCQVRPPDNIIAKFNWAGEEIQSGIEALITDLSTYRPHLVVCLGATALHLFRHGNTNLKKRKNKEGYKFVYPSSIDSWRGSIFKSQLSPGCYVKCLGAHHPAFCLRAYENTQLLAFDLKKAAREGTSPDIILPQRNLMAFPTFEEVIALFLSLDANPIPVSMDIEGYYTGMSCISIATSPSLSTTIPFFRKDGSSYWTEDEEVTITRHLSHLLMDSRIPKTWQNGLYDRWVLQYGFQMPVLGNVDDTMLKFWEKYCELPKGLATQTSLLTDEPYYKGERKTQDDSTFYLYCAKDSAVTYEINRRLDVLVSGPSRGHYLFNLAILNVLLYIELRGIAYNKKAAKARLVEVQSHIYRLQAQLNDLAGCGISRDLTPSELEAQVRAVCCYKRDPTKVKKDWQDSFPDVLKILSKPTLSEEDYGFLSTETNLGMNIKGDRFKAFLYEPPPLGLGFPLQYNKDSGAITTDGLTLLKLSKKKPHPVLDLAIQIALLRTRAQMLTISADPDGRIRCGYNVVGTVTGRLSCSTSPTGSGYNLQTIPDNDHSKPPSHPLRTGMRDLIVADPGHHMFQCDLKGSDGWTIGAHLNKLGDSTMLDDLRAGIKPAARICYMLRHGNHSLKGKTRPEIKELLREVKKEDWDYFACKVGIWGICYLMGPDLLADQIFDESDGKTDMSRKEIKDFRDAVFGGYSIKLWHDWMARHLAKKPEVTSASGNTRRFFGRSTEILGDALSTEPQNNTTYATNLAAYRLWTDRENRIPDKHILDSKGNIKHIPFRAEPLHQVHDALIVQSPIEDAEWTCGKLKSWFDNTLIIAGQRIVIPFEGNYGPSWGQQIYPIK